MKVNYRHIKMTLVIMLTLFLLGFSVKRNTVRNLKGSVIEFVDGDNLYMTYEMVNKLLIQNHGTLKNQSKEIIDLDKLEKRIIAHPMVADAEVYLTIDAVLGVRIKQKTPIARVNAATRTFYLDENGDRMPLSENYSARVPIVTGVADELSLRKVFTVAKVIYGDEFLRKEITGITVNPEGKIWLKTRSGNRMIKLGTPDNSKKKFENLKLFYRKAVADKSIRKYDTINIEFNNRVVCTKKKGYGNQ